MGGQWGRGVEGKTWGEIGSTQPDLDPRPCGWGPVGLGTSDSGLGFLRASFASSHPVLTPGLFYCFITFFSASVAKDA